MNITFVCNVPLDIGTGTSARTNGFIKALTSEGYKVNIIITRQRGENKFKYYLKLPFKIRPTNVIHCGPFGSCKLAFKLSKILHKPIIVDLHAAAQLENPITMEIELSYCKRADAIITPTEQLKKFYVSQGINEAKIAVIKNCILNISPPKAKKLDQFTVVFHGNLKNLYNIQALEKLSAVATQIRAKHPEVKFILVGDYGKNPPVENPAFTYKGYVENLYQTLNSAHLAIVPVETKSLGIRSRILNYLALRIPIITTPSSAIGYETAVSLGAIYVAKTVNEIAEKLLELNENPKELELMSSACLTALEEFSPEKTAQRLVEIYKHALSKRR